MRTMAWVSVLTVVAACVGSDGSTDETDDPGTTDTTGGTDTTDDDTETEPRAARFSDVEVLLNRNCSTIGCHAGPELETGLDLSDGNAYASLVGVPSAQVPTMNRVEPGDPVNSYLIAKMEDRQFDVGGEGDLMPPGFGLSEADVAVFASWIEAGALED